MAALRRSARPAGGIRARRGPHAASRAPRPVACAIVTVSDSRRGREDVSGAVAEHLVRRAGHRVVSRAWTPDQRASIRRAVRAALARTAVDVVVVTGGTGIARRDVTPEALEPLFEKRLPGFGEAFRAASWKQVGAAAWLSRADAGVAKGRLLVMLPGSVRAVELALGQVLLPELAHAVRMLGRFPSEE